MPRYAVLRWFQPPPTRAELDAGAMQVVISQASYIYRGGQEQREGDHGIAWVRSYWQEGESWAMCVYDAPNPAELATFQDLCANPFVDIREITEIASADRTDAETGKTVLPGEGVRFSVSRAYSEGVMPPAESLEVLLPQGATEELPAVEWVRSYWDAQQRRAVSLYGTESAESVERIAAACAPLGAEVRPVVEIYPDEYGG